MKKIIYIPFELTIYGCKHCHCNYSIIAYFEHFDEDSSKLKIDYCFLDGNKLFCPLCGKEQKNVKNDNNSKK